MFGYSVNVASRMCSLAPGSQTLTGNDSTARLSATLRDLKRFINAMLVKGKAKEIEVYEFVWQASDDYTTITGRRGDVFAGAKLRAIALW